MVAGKSERTLLCSFDSVMDEDAIAAALQSHVVCEANRLHAKFISISDGAEQEKHIITQSCTNCSVVPPFARTNCQSYFM